MLTSYIEIIRSHHFDLIDAMTRSITQIFLLCNPELMFSVRIAANY